MSTATTTRTALRLNNDFRAICKALVSFRCNRNFGLKIEELAAATSLDEERIRRTVKHFAKLGYLTTLDINNEIVRTNYTETV